MKTLKIKIQLFSPWHCGSGLSAGADADARVLRDRQGFPFLPGRTLKGLVREAAENYVALRGLDINLDAAFGREATDAPTNVDRQGTLYFSDAHLPVEERMSIDTSGLLDGLYINKVSTAIDPSTGIASEHSLRTIETVVPCTLYAAIHHVADELAAPLAASLGWVKQIGLMRHRGLGRCQLSVDQSVEEPSMATADISHADSMTSLQFRCTLLTDIILSQRAATEGSHETLDFIPGNNFLGLVARSYDQLTARQQADVFHSGQVRFGDAHPVPAGGRVRSLRVPASFFHPKLSDVTQSCCIHHAYDRSKDHEGLNGAPQQLKQCRAGFYVFKDNTAQRVETAKAFAIKSAYDRDHRRARDSQMFGYESLAKGTELLFTVSCQTSRPILPNPHRYLRRGRTSRRWSQRQPNKLAGTNTRWPCVRAISSSSDLALATTRPT